MKITTIGIDLAKNVFQVHGVDARGKVQLCKQLSRTQMQTFFANLPPCLIGMEACAGAHFWARKLQEQGHTVKLMAPQFVKPYVKSNKNDARDAEAICEAVSRPNMRFVPVKTEAQQLVLSLHRVREGFVQARTAQGNRIRGLLAEFGLVVPQGMRSLFKALPVLIADETKPLATPLRSLLQRLYLDLRELDRQVAELEAAIVQGCRSNPVCQRLLKVRGVGPISASALEATLGDNVDHFNSGRAMAAFLGLVPRQHSSGGKNSLLGISKRGDGYLRKLLVHGARAVATTRQPEESWLGQLLQRRPTNVAVVAQANKTARIIWALLKHPEREYSRDYAQATARA
jgi:transposase